VKRQKDSARGAVQGQLLCPLPGIGDMPLPRAAASPVPLTAGLPQESPVTPSSLLPWGTGPGEILHTEACGVELIPGGKRIGSRLAEG